MGVSETLSLFFVAFIVIPISVESSICLYPNPQKDGAVCNWKQKEWIREFDLETRKYYYTLKTTSQSDNFIERKMRKRYLNNNKKKIKEKK